MKGRRDKRARERGGGLKRMLKGEKGEREAWYTSERRRRRK